MAIVELNRKVAAAGDLPPVCVHCGAPAVAYRRRSFSGRSPITITAGLGILRAKLPVCQRHRYYTWMRMGVLLGLVAVWVTLLFTIGSLDNKPNTPAFLAPLAPWRGALILACGVSFLAMVVARFVTFYTDVRLYGATWDAMWLTGVSDAFADAWQQRNARTWVDDVTRASATEPVAATLADGDDVVLLADATDGAPAPHAGPAHVIPGKRRTVSGPLQPTPLQPTPLQPGPPRPTPQSPPAPQRPVVAGVAGDPPGRGGLSTWLLVGIIAVCLCGGVPTAAWLGVSMLDDTKVRIHSVRTSPIGALGTYLRLSYRAKGVDPQATYWVVVRQDERIVLEYKVSGDVLRKSGPVEFGVISGPFGASGPVELMIEEERVGEGRAQVSNVRTVEVNQ